MRRWRSGANPGIRKQNEAWPLDSKICHASLREIGISERVGEGITKYALSARTAQDSIGLISGRKRLSTFVLLYFGALRFGLHDAGNLGQFHVPHRLQAERNRDPYNPAHRHAVLYCSRANLIPEWFRDHGVNFYQHSLDRECVNERAQMRQQLLGSNADRRHDRRFLFCRRAWVLFKQIDDAGSQLKNRRHNLEPVHSGLFLRNSPYLRN